MKIEAQAPAKIILCGEHAVVYNHPAIAIPIFQLMASATIEITNKPFQIISHKTIETPPPLVDLAKLVCQDLFGYLPEVTLHLDSAIPVSSGLGSGAAIATAITRALFRLAQKTEYLEQINAYVFETEKQFHGTPSGIDNVVIVHEKPVFFVKNQPIETFSIPDPIYLVVANSGEKAPTKETVLAVRNLRDEQPTFVASIFDQIDRLTRNTRIALSTGDAQQLGQLLFHNHQLLKLLQVSSDRLDMLVDTAIQAGAIGAKLSGAGRGGNMIAVASDEQSQSNIETTLRQAGGEGVFSTVLYTIKH